MKRLLRRRASVLGFTVLAAALAALAIWRMLPDWTADRTAAASYVGAQRCAGCHAAQTAAWQRSHHAKSMAPADSGSVQGDFNGTSFDYAGVATRFHRDGDRYLVDTDGADGHPHMFAAGYTFGVFPLQQYLLPGEHGALQALTVAWDARPKADGGQHWFHLHPGEAVDHDSPLHWTAPAQNWNFMCADCHSTHLEKNYDAASHRFDTHWSDVDVACEACHGPASAHVRWAKWASLPLLGALAGRDAHLQLRFDERSPPDRLIHVLDPKAPLDFTPGVEVQVCAQCHSRRSQLTNAYVPREGYGNHYEPELLSEPLYYVDGQMREEVYEYGSFQQSRMFAKGVTCSDCHDPHTAQLRMSGNALCLQCHEQRFDAPAHHFHAVGSAGSQCVNCHMPTHTYMEIDARRDHSIRIPRPDESVRFGTPNACNACHAEQSARWAADWIVRRYGAAQPGLQQFAGQLDAIRNQSAAAESALRELVMNGSVPDVVKATALSEIGPYLHTGMTDVLSEGLNHSNTTVRLGALRGLEEGAPDLRWSLAAPLLNDAQRSVRIEAARILGGIPALSAEQRQRLDPSWSEFLAAVNANADRAEWRSLYATTLAERGEVQAAVHELQAALGLNPRFAGAYVNLADLYRQTGRDDLCEQTLAAGLAMVPGSAALHAATGLSLVRRRRFPDAVGELAQAVRLDPDNVSYGYLYAVALQTRSPRDAQRFLQTAMTQTQHRHSRAEFLLLLQTSIKLADRAAVQPYLAELRALAPLDPQAQSVLRQVE